MSNFEPSDLDRLSAATEEQVETNEHRTSAASSENCCTITNDAIDLLSQVPIEQVLGRTARIAVLGHKYATDLEVNEMELGSFLRELCNVDPDLRMKHGPVYLQGAAKPDNKRHLETVEILAFDIDDGPAPRKTVEILSHASSSRMSNHSARIRRAHLSVNF